MHCCTMFLREIGKSMLRQTGPLHWCMDPLFFNRGICTSNPQYVRRLRSGSFGLSEKEMDDPLEYDTEDMHQPSLDELQHHIHDLEGEATKFQKFIQQKTIKRKFFKEYEPVEENLLTWEMKDQLKYLHHTDPEQWTPEALSVAFPISPQGVQRLLRSNWTPENEQKIEKHDRAVIARWRKYTNGRLGSAKLLEEALKKRIGQENLPAPIMDPDRIMSTLESLKFEYDEKPKSPSAGVGKKLRPKRKQKIRSGSFVSIIENYESQLSQKESSEKKQSSLQPKHVDVSSLIPSVPEYEGAYSKVESKKSCRYKRSFSKNKKDMMTFEEFMKTKTNS